MRIVVTGGAGFIGSNIVDALLARGDDVVVADDFSTGDEAFLESARTGPHAAALRVVKTDLFSEGRLADLFHGAQAVVHLAANADVRFGWSAPRRDIEQNVLVTHNVLEGARLAGVEQVLFSSTGSVYGEALVVPTPEECAIPVQTSLYGASKFAAEGFLGAYTEGTSLCATVFRFVSILGPRYTHGHVIDFVRQLREHPDHLVVLGDGAQRKSYLDVSDCVAAVLSRIGAKEKFEVFNLGVDGYCTVRDSIGWITARMGLEPELRFTGGDRGWIGDNPFIYLDTSRIRATGWKPSYAIREAVERTVDFLLEHPDVLDREEHRT